MKESIDKATSSLLDIIKLRPKYLIGIIFFTGSFLVVGWFDRLRGFFGIKSDLFNSVKVWFSIIFLMAISMLLSHIFDWMQKTIKNNIAKKRDLKDRQRMLNDLTKEEKEILNKYIEGNTKTQYLYYTNGVVRGLELQLIIFKATQISVGGTKFPYNIQPWAWEYLNQNKHLVEIVNEEVI